MHAGCVTGAWDIRGDPANLASCYYVNMTRSLTSQRNVAKKRNAIWQYC